MSAVPSSSSHSSSSPSLASPASASSASSSPQFPVGAGVLLGLGLGGFFDGIVLHQLLQWHHMLSSAGFSADDVHDLKVNTLADGLFHASTYIFVIWGLSWLWRAARRPHFLWSAPLLFATVLMGFGIFNVVEGLVDHQLLGIHHVNETVPREQWIYWDIGFLLWGAAMLVGGWVWMRRLQNKALSGVSGVPYAGSPGAAMPGASLNPGDEAPEGAPGTGEAICRECGGTGRNAAGTCIACGGDGKVTVALAGG